MAVKAVEQKIVIAMETVENKTSNLVQTDLEIELKQYAKNHHVPIIMDEGLEFLNQIILLRKPKKILEIGTAIGYSAIHMASVCGSHITTIERDSKMIEQAKKNIQRANLSSQIHLIEMDALESFSVVQNEQFDLIFIDAAKAQYIKFFELYSPLLTKCGVIVTDNMNFHGLLDEELYQQQSRSVRGLIRKLSAYHTYLLDRKDFSTTIYNIGDGMALSIKKDE
ncbi:MAG: O-methyltransferase [Anaeroplasmataceae bacterium]|nr:O-methyltransferase [Anaeroplasmataceae bacterium]